MIIKASTCVSIDGGAFISSIGLVVVTAGYMTTWHVFIWWPNYSHCHHPHRLLLHHPLHLTVSQDMSLVHSPAPQFKPFKATWSRATAFCSAILFSVPTVSRFLTRREAWSSVAYLSGRSEAAASVPGTRRRKGHVVFVSTQLLASSRLLLNSYGWRCCSSGLIFTVCWPPQERKEACTHIAAAARPERRCFSYPTLVNKLGSAAFRMLFFFLRCLLGLHHLQIAQASPWWKTLFGNSHH